MKKLFHKKLDERGFDHVFLMIVFIVLFAIMGIAYLVYTRAASTPAPIVNSGGKCLDNYANLTRENNRIILYACNSTDAQKWVVNNGGAIVNANGYCLTATGTTSASAVTLNKCTGANNQRWSYNATSKAITSVASGLCLDNHANLNVDSNKIQVYTCNSTNAQKWTPQTVVAPAAAPVIGAFAANPTSIAVNQTAKLSWTTSNTASCSVAPGGPTDTTATSWTTPAQTTSGTKTFTLTCKNNDGVATTKATSFTVAATTTPSSSTTGFDVGMAYAGNGDPASFESAWGVKLEARRTYFGPSDQTKAANMVKADIAAGRKTSSISFKVPASWADMAAGKQDAWAKNLADTLVAANSSGHTIRVAFHHEPENDTGTNNGSSAAGRDAWKNMQAHLSTFYDKPGIQYVAILMGYHTLNGSSTMKSLWSLDASIPTNAKVKGVGFDAYQTKDVNGNTKWTDMNAYFTLLGTWARAHNMAWGISETGVSSAAFAERPTYFTDTIAQMKAQGGDWFEYFNSDLNSPDPKWSFTASEQRGKAFGALLKTERAN
jgi:hypothetical protein